ncbi:MAG: M20/M25/M40 family metallo-hydrolase, partial [bacterium]
ICIAGVETGRMHNRVYGTGRLLLNFAYPSLDVGVAIERLVDDAFRAALARFCDEYASCEVAHSAAVAASDICSLTWLKRRLPVLANRVAEMEALLRRAGINRHDEASPSAPFTCDAMWLGGPGCYSVVLGPGGLIENNAHAPGEFMRIADLDRFADQVASIVLAFMDLPC